MNSMTKMALVGASVFSMGALTACQSTNSVQDKEGDHARMMQDHHRMSDHKMTPEQREQFQQARAERQEVMKSIKTACDGKAVGSAVQVKAGEKTIDGTCMMRFTADRAAMKQMRREHHPMQGEMKDMRMMHHGEPLTDAKRAELTKQFDQRLAERQAHQQAMLKACQGKANGTAVQVKVGTHSMNGKCEVRFQPKMPVAPAPVKSTP
ncbi:hypothetical protein [Acinetobacter bouvetii]|uniref:Uncharacterized protein n=1 Tax=Acinetobacter bouvetii TaxID=202951 RepID=A0A811GJU5_9GAMM|nr:hypothetical protein [Acinetobacter bouvetii]CAB1217371.1 hypothetical protein SFB21_2068 [Acinetobacter bouvetii]